MAEFFKKSRCLKIIVALFAVFFCACIFWEYAVPHIFYFDTEKLESRFPATIFCDRQGEPLHTESGFDYEMRFPVSLNELPKHLIDITLAAEDRNFFEHDGVDLGATARAALQLLTNRRIVSGASTVTMQVVAMADGRERSFMRKFVQMGRARNLETQWTKQKILEEYFNRLPYGGKIVGIEAAAQYYFGRPASDLNFAESVMLAGIPQRPNRYRPDRFPEAALERRERVLEMLVRQGVFSREKAEDIRREPLRFRDFSRPRFVFAQDPQFFQWLRKNSPTVRGKCVTTLDSALQEIVHSIVSMTLSDSFSVRDGAVVVVDNKTRAVRAFLGTADFRNPKDGQVNAVTSWRSPGSLLKPFIFGEAVNGGLIVADSAVDDSPLTLGDYRPGNFSGTFLGKVSARTALAKSLNTPAVRLADKLGVERVYTMLDGFGIGFSGKHTPQSVGLSIAIGGAETTLWKLAGAYATLAGGSVPEPLKCIEAETTNGAGNAESAIWNPGTSEMVLQMLSDGALPGAETLPVAWKTGTSNGLRDAWCVAVTPEWTVAVWFGNKDGSPAPELVGAEIAAPAAGKIMAALYRNSVPAPAWQDNAHFASAPLCARSGLAVGPYCSATRKGTVVSGIPLRQCRECKFDAAKLSHSRTAKIVEPHGGVYRCGFNGKARFVLRSIPEQAHWYLNGKYLGFFKSGTTIEVPPGKYTLFAWPGEDYASAKLTIEVK